MSKIKDVIQTKKKIRELTETRNIEQINSLRVTTAFRARLHGELEKLDLLFESGEVESVVVDINDNMIALFTEAMYKEDTAEFNISQVYGSTSKFEIRRGMIQF